MGGLNDDATSGAGLVRPSTLEVAAGWTMGMGEGDAFVARSPGRGGPGPRQVLEEVLLAALERPPCVVDFSGGRDSSLVLAVAAHVARREGLPLPVAYTRRFPADRAANEDGWQEMVIAHLRLPDWERANFSGGLDLVGERAQAFMRRYGLLLPSTLYVLAESFEVARGGSHVTGEGGDEVFGPAPLRRAWAALALPGALAHPRRGASALVALGPRPVRALRLWRRYLAGGALPCARWLQPEALRRVALMAARQFGGRPNGSAAGLRWHLRQRSVLAHEHNMGLIAADYSVLHLDPILDAGFVAALASSRKRFGFASRQEAMSFVAGDLLPATVLGRATKATFNTA
ncbi:MAG: asparagine synthase-related protein, partial [Acidimicrobiales bacterium]